MKREETLQRPSWRHLRARAVATLLLLASGAVPVSGDDEARSSAGPGLTAELPPCQVSFLNRELLSNPTHLSITVSLVPAEGVELFVEYGTDADHLTERTAPQMGEPETLTAITLDGLLPGRRYAYRVRYRGRDDEGGFCAGPVRHFRTLREPGAVFSFAFSTDSHIYLGYLRAHCHRRQDSEHLDIFHQSLENMRRHDLDFLVVGGDEAFTHCEHCPPCQVDGEYAGKGTIRSARQAELRYRVMRRAYESIAHSLPFFYTLGNHDGETGFGDREGTCGHYDTTLSYSLAARQKHLPNPSRVYPAGPDGNYLAFESGDALFVILDVLRYTLAYPRSADDWTLGAEQLHWLEEVLRRSGKAWKFLFMHHLVGGLDGGDCYSYARGGLRATTDRTIRGTFSGEQAKIHALMKQHGAQIMFLGHEHLFIMGEKQDAAGRPEGVFYVHGGRIKKQTIQDKGRRLFVQRSYDYNGDSRPDYQTAAGFVKVTVFGPWAARVQYLKTDIEQPEENGRILHDQVIPGGLGLGLHRLFLSLRGAVP